MFAYLVAKRSATSQFFNISQLWVESVVPLVVWVVCCIYLVVQQLVALTIGTRRGCTNEKAMALCIGYPVIFHTDLQKSNSTKHFAYS